MLRFLLSALLLLAVIPASADLPPPPGYSVEPDVRPNPRTNPRANPRLDPRSGGSSSSESSTTPRVQSGMLIIDDEVGDYSKSTAKEHLDFVRVTLIPMSESDVLVSIQFAAPMPDVVADDEYVDIFFSLDLDNDASTGTQFGKLGIDCAIKFKGYDSAQPWEGRVKAHSEVADAYGLEVQNVQYGSQTLSFLLRSTGPEKLKIFGLHMGSMANYRSVDTIPENPPLYIDLNLVNQ